ncbi:glycerophosphodiester phosphodiesterase [Paenibacillus piri]|nr:glycerophosphodiester phosphodiesterase family protein [Paenibacillus piri]
MFMNIAHRGASQYAPENTMAAFYKSLEMGANGLETDLRKSKDGVIILHHDEQLERTTNGTGRPSDYTWKQLQMLDAGSWFSEMYRGERLVSFDTFLYVFGGKPIHLALEMKESGIENEVIQILKEHEELMEKVTITSFDFEILQTIRQRHDSVRLGHLVRQWDEEHLKRLQEIGVIQICPPAETVTPEGVRLLKQHGFEVRAWKVVNESMMKHCLRSGVDGMTINYPDKLNDALQSNVYNL